MSRIAQVANFVAPHSGGIRTVLAHLAEGYAAAGHEVVQIVPGDVVQREDTVWGVRQTLPSVPLPGTGYRVLTPSIVKAALRHVDADHVEVHDRATLRSIGPWCARHDVPALVVSHERLDRLVLQWTPRAHGAAGRFAARHNRRLAEAFTHVVCTTDWAAEEFADLPTAALRTVPLGVDLDVFSPARRDAAEDDRALLVLASRLSPEKAPATALAVVRELVRRGTRVTLAVAGDGPLRPALERNAEGLPVTFLGHVRGRPAMARLLASADVVLAPGPVETFGLAALEALACGTPVISNARSALPSVVGDAGLAVEPGPANWADAVQALLDAPERTRRARARRRAERFPWSATVRGFLDVHGLVGGCEAVPA